MALRYGSRSRPGTMVSTWLNGLVSGTAVSGAGYFGGGRVSGWAKQTTVNKFAFPTDGRTTLGTGLSAGNGQLAGLSNNGTAGYFGGGDDASGLVTWVDKFAFSDDSRTTISATLTVARKQLAGMANSGTAGYFGGGAT